MLIHLKVLHILLYEYRLPYLWVRDRFLMPNLARQLGEEYVAIPLGQGQVFNVCVSDVAAWTDKSQSLWVRDRFLIDRLATRCEMMGRNPFGSGTGF